MKKFYRIVCFLTIIFSFNTQAQNNALAFDGIDDNVIVPGASSLIAGSAALSLTVWVYPTNPTPTFPNFDGFAGFRNNLDADFYLMQYSATNIEARFRGSSGAVYDLTTSVLTLNTWTHLAFTYDGSFIRLYKNGIIADSLPASDFITVSTEDFYIGDLLYQGTHYYLQGKVDEVSLWNRALQPAELTCMHINGIDTATANGLQLYYKCNQGIANGNNTSQTSLIDAAGNINGVFGGMALTGTNSNFVNGAALITTSTQFKCPDVGYNWNGIILNAGGVYYDTLQNVFGCDSIIQLTLSNLLVDTSVTQNGAVLSANLTSLYYQWIDCSNGFAPIPGATNKTFTATAIGSYAVIVLQSGCYDTSGCRTVTSVGLNDPSAGTEIQVFPTASNSTIHIRIANGNFNYRLQLMDMSGRMITEEIINNTIEYDFDISRFATGSYQLLIVNEKQQQTLFKVFRK
ncbi:MAG: LamG-like jellyroll fold domain-containing protein [Bacteroidia bacterium]